MLHCASRCTVGNTVYSVLRRCHPKRHYSPMFTETTSTDLTKAKGSEVQKRRDPTMLEEVDVKKLPRAERRHVEEFLKMSETRAVAMRKLSYKNLATFVILFGLAAGIYIYTFYGLKQETFLEEIDEEVTAEIAERKQ